MTGNIKDVEIRAATAQDMLLFYPEGSPRTTYSWVAYYRGIPACLAGLIVERGGCIAYSEIREGIKSPKITIWRTAKALLSHIKALGLPMYAACDLVDISAQAFVKRLGFSSEREYQGMELFTWQK